MFNPWYCEVPVLKKEYLVVTCVDQEKVMLEHHYKYIFLNNKIFKKIHTDLKVIDQLKRKNTNNC